MGILPRSWGHAKFATKASDTTVLSKSVPTIQNSENALCNGLAFLRMMFMDLEYVYHPVGGWMGR